MERKKREYPRFDLRLPECGARFGVDADKGVYFCAHPRVATKHNIVSSVICRSCMFLGQPLPEKLLPFRLPPTVDYSGPCRYFGELRGLRNCPTCRGNVQVKVYACAHPEHQETTVSECRECADYAP